MFTESQENFSSHHDYPLRSQVEGRHSVSEKIEITVSKDPWRTLRMGLFSLHVSSANVVLSCCYAIALDMPLSYLDPFIYSKNISEHLSGNRLCTRHWAL